MKKYCVDMDVTFSARMYVEAVSKEQAKRKAVSDMEKDPRYHTRWGAYVDTAVTDIYEE
jgi:hypothetical protein